MLLFSRSGKKWNTGTKWFSMIMNEKKGREAMYWQHCRGLTKHSKWTYCLLWAHKDTKWIQYYLVFRYFLKSVAHKGRSQPTTSTPGTGSYRFRNSSSSEDEDYTSKYAPNEIARGPSKRKRKKFGPFQVSTERLGSTSADSLDKNCLAGVSDIFIDTSTSLNTQNEERSIFNSFHTQSEQNEVCLTDWYL